MDRQAKKQQKADHQQQRERLATGIAGKIAGTQSRIANRLNRLAGKATRKQQILLFILLILLFGGYCLYLIWKNVR